MCFSNLANLDLLSLSDPICTLFIRDEETNLYYEMERTEMVKDDLDPVFSKSILLNSMKNIVFFITFL